METKNEPKTLEEANYQGKPTNCCENCVHAKVYDCYGYLQWCNKFNETVHDFGVCDCYE